MVASDKVFIGFILAVYALLGKDNFFPIGFLGGEGREVGLTSASAKMTSGVSTAARPAAVPQMPRITQR